jgi:transposase-like protein
MISYPQNIEQFEDLFKSEDDCIRYLIQVRWPNGFICEKCQSTKHWLSGKLLGCSTCGNKVRILAGTIFQDTKLPLMKWFRAIWEVVRRKSGVSALALQDELGLTYKTVWTLLHKIRRAMVRPGREKLKGTVEVDETLYGSFEEGHPGRGSDKKALIIIGVELNDNDSLGRIRMSLIESASADNINVFIEENIDKEANIITDGWSGYHSISKHGYKHDVKCISNEKEALPHVHLVISLFKRWILGTYQGGISRDQLECYLDEHVFRFNRRMSKNRGLLFQRIIENSVKVEPVTYNKISRGTKPYSE